MKNRSIVIMLLLSLFALYVPAITEAAAAPAITKLAVKQGVSFRDAPDTSSHVMRYLKTGETVTALSYVNPSWYKIQDQNGVIGYVTTNARYITQLSNAVIKAAVSFRTGPSTSYTRMRFLQAGEEILVLEQMENGWYRAQDAAGVTGYVSNNPYYIDTDLSVTGIIRPLSDRIEAIIGAGLAYLGTPYEFGSQRFEPSTFDCSDFVQQSFWDGARTVLPGDSKAQVDYIKKLQHDVWDWHNLKRGDLVFFMSYKGSSASDYAGIDKTTETITHVGIYLGNGQILHTYSVKSGGVRISNLAGTNWENRFLFGGSVY